MSWPSFSLNVPNLDGLVIRRRKIFECGVYGPPQNFSLAPEEALQAAADFAPVEIDIQHVPSVLDGKLGYLLTLVPEQGGRVLFGDVGIPKWLDEVLQGTPVELSASWDRFTKRLRRLALVIRGRIPDTALMAAYASFTQGGSDFEGRRNSVHDQAMIQEVHDLSRSFGASCGASYAYADRPSIQRIHDLSQGLGATCYEPQASLIDAQYPWAMWSAHTVS